MDTRSTGLVALCLCLVLALGAGTAVVAGQQTGPLAQQAIDADDVVMTASGDAQWQVTYRIRLDSDAEVQAFEDLQADIEAERATGNMSEGRYRAEIARTTAEIRTVERLTNQSADVARGLPTTLLEERGVNADRIAQLRANASDLTGPEVAEIARGIAGKGVGQSPVDTPAPDVGPPGNDTDDRRRGPPGQSDGQQNGPAEQDSAAGGQQNDTAEQTGDTDSTRSDDSPGQSGY